jgi:hypothetical protein
MDTKTANAHGFENGYSIAISNKSDFISLGSDEYLSMVLETESDTFRQYLSFEFLASEFNKSKNSESLWDNYDKGVEAGAKKAIVELKKEFKEELSLKEEG